MKILISSHAFHPSIGGLENVSAMLAEEFVRKGHQVRLVTQTPGEGADGFPFPVIRRPRPAMLLALIRWCDLYFQNHLSLRTAWPLLLVPEPWVVALQTWIPDGWLGRLKRLALRSCHCVSISDAIATHAGVRSIVIPNPYDDLVFRELADVSRDKDLLFVGRLVSDKGTALLLEALGSLAASNLHPRLTIVGTGPEEPRLRSMAAELGLNGRVSFAGAKRGIELARLLNRHRIVVVPSTWLEPLGVVALEAIACGCVVVGSEGGGLADAIGPCGLTFPNGEVAALAARLATLLSTAQGLAPYRARAAEHLSRHTRSVVGDAYLRVFDAARRGRSLSTSERVSQIDN